MISTFVPPIVTTFDVKGVETLGTSNLFNSKAILEPIAALFLMSATSIHLSKSLCHILLDFEESPPLNSLTLFNMKGVTSCPEIFFSL